MAAILVRKGVVSSPQEAFDRYKPDLQVGIGRGDLVVPADVLANLDARRPSPV